MVGQIRRILEDAAYIARAASCEHRPPLTLRRQVMAMVEFNRTQTQAIEDDEARRAADIALAVGAVMFLMNDISPQPLSINVEGLSASVFLCLDSEAFRQDAYLRAAEYGDSGIDLGVADTLLSAMIMSISNAGFEEDADPDLGEGLAM